MHAMVRTGRTFALTLAVVSAASCGSPRSANSDVHAFSSAYRAVQPLAMSGDAKPFIAVGDRVVVGYFPVQNLMHQDDGDATFDGVQGPCAFTATVLVQLAPSGTPIGLVRVEAVAARAGHCTARLTLRRVSDGDAVALGLTTYAR